MKNKRLKHRGIRVYSGTNTIGYSRHVLKISNDIFRKTILAALVTSCVSLNASAFDGINPSAHVDSSYGHADGTKEKYFIFVKNSSDNYILQETADSNNYDFVVKYAPNSYTSYYNKPSSPLMQNASYENFGMPVSEDSIIRINGNMTSNIIADFIDITKGGGVAGAAISNTYNSTFKDISGNFINIKNIASYESAGNPAIRIDRATAGNITGNFINNQIIAITDAYGGAITNARSNIGIISGNFIGNNISTSSTSKHSIGGAIALYGDSGNLSKTNLIHGNFIGNWSYNKGYQSKGGAIFNQNNSITNGIVNSNFYGNYAYTQTGTPMGGALYNNGNAITLYADGNSEYGDGTSTFKGNYIQKGSGTKQYEAIYNTNTITFNAKNNGQFYLYDYINGTNGHSIKFTGDNTGKVNLYNDVKNGAVSTDTVTMNLANNEIHNYSIRTLNSNENTKWVIDIDIDNKIADTIQTDTSGSTGKVTLSNLKFINGSISDIIDQNLKIQVLKNAANNNNLQLAIDNSIKSSTVPKVISEVDTYVVNGITKDVNWIDTYDLIKTHTTVTGTLDVATTDTTNDSIGVKVTSVDVDTNLGTIDTLKAINTFDTTEDRTFSASTVDETYKVTDDIGTTASGKLSVIGQTDGENRSTLDFDSHTGFELDNNDTELVLKDVAVVNANSLVSGTAGDNVKVVLDNVVLDGSNGGVTTFGEVDIKGNSTISDDVTVLGTNSKLDIDGTDEVTLDSSLTGSGTSTLALTNGTINLSQNAQVMGFDATITDANLNIAKESSLAGLNTTFEGTNNLNIANNSVSTLALGNVNLNGLVTMQVDADLANKSMDKLTATSATVGANGAINVDKINLLSPTTNTKTSLLFTDNNNLANAISYTGEGTIAYSPIFKYKTSYNVKDGQGYFDFVIPSKPGPGPSPSPTPSDFNPAILTSPVATQAGSQSAMNQALYYSFEHGDTFMNNAAADRFAQMNTNSYALSTDYNENGERIDYNNANKAVWVKPYAVFENLPLKNGPKVDTISYGTLIGFDSDFHKLKNGWTNVGTAYIGYNGSQLKYSGVDTSTNGGMLGVTETFYKGNFWTALTATAGASVAEANTMYGHDDMTSLMAGIGSKTGYNFEFADGKFIIQPRIFLAYSMIKTFDYTNAAGVRINSDPLHTIQINPAIKFIGNIKDWQPYASVGMNWNLINQTKVSANGVKLPEMHQKPYVEYGVGVQKHWNNKYSAYGQAMVRNGGRNGIALSLGFKAALGKEGKPIEKVQNPDKLLKGANNNLSAPMGEVARSAEGVNNIAQANENNNSMSLQGADAMWQSSTNNEILKQVRNDNKQVLNDNTTTLSLVGEGRVRYEQDAIQNHTSSAYGTFSYSLGEGRLLQNDNKKVLKSLSLTKTSMIGKIK